ncbi:hypothetical protein SDC9_137345 [bioreactor metagenome]|uniref:Uncharacterized protein n=1 Tax=bioreactor metagenome TaxID=1076179 RepID=A0A645DLA1_9ZZZZ
MAEAQTEEMTGQTVITGYKTSVSRQELVEANYNLNNFIVQESPASYGDSFYEPAVRILHKIYEEQKQCTRQ